MYISRAETSRVKGFQPTGTQSQDGHTEERDHPILDTRDNNDMETVRLEDTDAKTGAESMMKA